MSRFKLQDYGDGAIYKHSDGKYEVETSLGKSIGTSTYEALQGLSKFTKAIKKEQSKKRKRTKKVEITESE